MKKIIIEKGQGIAEVIDEILNEPDSEITLVVPKGSALGNTVSNFRLLKREADAAGRTVAIESVDEAILGFAKEYGLEASHPLWRGVRGGGMSDIVPKIESGEEEERPAARSGKKKRKLEVRVERDEEPEEEEQAEEDEEAEEESPRRISIKHNEDEAELEHQEEEEDHFFTEEKNFKDRALEWLPKNRFFSPVSRSEEGDEDEEGEGRRISGKTIGIIAGIVVLALGGAYIASAFFNHATVGITFKKTPWNWSGQLSADKSVAADNLAASVIAGQVFTSNKNLTQTFKASSVQNVSLKAQGTITVYNDYSTAPQVLIATTRFQTPDGKIFRITKTITVPGASSSGGKLAASSITAPIIADQPGPDYNIGPVAKLSIPGFAGKPEQNGFWGAITASTTGGYIGQKAVPTAADIAAAEASTTALLQESLKGGFSGTYPNNFKILDGATQIQVAKLSVNTSTDVQGDFSIFGQATLSAIGFDEGALKQALLANAQQQEPSSTFADVNLDYSNVTANFSAGQVSFSLTAQGNLEPALSIDDFRQQLLGKSVSDARTTIAALPQLESGQISIWPSWLWTIPSDPAKVTVNVD